MLTLQEQRTPTILWDMNGVLLDDEPVHEKCFAEILRSYCGIELTHEDYIAYFYGKTDFLGMENYFATVEPDVSVTTLNLMCGEKNRLYVDYFKQGLTITANARELLEDLSSKNYKQALVTCDQRPDVEAILCDLLPNVFGSVVTAQDVQFSKPYADPYVKASVELGTDISDCIVIEDSSAGVISAKKAGARVIGYSEFRSAKHARELEIVGSEKVETDFSSFCDDYFSSLVDA